VQTGNKDDLLSLDFVLRDWEEDDPREIVRKYPEFVYESGHWMPALLNAAELPCRRQDLTGPVMER